MRRCRPAFAALGLLAILAGGAHAQGLRSKIDQLFIFGSAMIHSFSPAPPIRTTRCRSRRTERTSCRRPCRRTDRSSRSSRPRSPATCRTRRSVRRAAARRSGSRPASRCARRRRPDRSSPNARQTLGRGRTVVGIGRSSSHFSSLRGVRLHRHRSLSSPTKTSTSPGCDSIQGGSCKLMGIPLLENDIMQFKLEHGHQRRRQLRSTRRTACSTTSTSASSCRSRRRRCTAAATRRSFRSAARRRRTSSPVRRAIRCCRRVATSTGRRSGSATSPFAPRSVSVSPSEPTSRCSPTRGSATGDGAAARQRQFTARGLAILSEPVRQLRPAHKCRLHLSLRQRAERRRGRGRSGSTISWPIA